MYIKQLTIKNYRNFGDPPFLIELKPFTLILGENNVGKTNLLNALSLVFSQEITIFRQRILELDDINYEAVRHFKLAVSDTTILANDVIFPEVKIDVLLTDLTDEQSAAAGDWPAPDDKSLSRFLISYCFAPRSSLNQEEWVENQRAKLPSELSDNERVDFVEFPIGEYRYSLFGSDDPSNKCDLHYLNMFKMDLLDALRDAKSELIASGSNRLLFRLLSQRDEANYEDIKSSLNDLNSMINKNSNLTDIVSEVEHLLNRVSLETANTDNSVRFRFASPETSEILRKLSLRYGKNPVDVSRNGLGRNNLLYISLILSHLSAMDAQNNETVFRLIAIEEPEAHLHPHLQDHLAKNIEDIRTEANERMQLLLTSHSTHITAKLGLENIVIIYLDHNSHPTRFKNHYLIDKLDKKEDADSIRYLAKYVDATKSRMFFARKIILVEGISEQLLIPLFFKMFFEASLEKLGCNVINVNGLAFKHFLKIIESGYFIKSLVLTDSDAGTKTANRALTLKENYESSSLIQVCITENDTFEKDVIASNKSGKGRKILEAALELTRPRLGNAFIAKHSGKDFKTDELFILIEDHKSEFAFNLAKELAGDSEGFKLPEYIEHGFHFLR